MTTINAYATLTDFKAWANARGGTTGTDTTDDGVIESILESASRYCDQWTNRTFYPRYETHYFSVPDARGIMFDDDLLAAVTVTNGDTNTIASTEYYLLPRNQEPKYSIVLEAGSTYYWETNSAGEDEYVINIAGWWGYHNQYTQRGWQAAGTLGAAQSSTSTLTFTLTAGHSCVSGQIWKIDNEILNGSVSSNTLTAIARGDNGSTAATHLNGATIYYWKPMDIIKNATLEIANSVYARRSGQASAGKISVTASGVVIRPEEVPPTAQMALDNLVRLS